MEKKLTFPYAGRINTNKKEPPWIDGMERLFPDNSVVLVIDQTYSGGSVKVEPYPFSGDPVYYIHPSNIDLLSPEEWE